MPEWLIRIQEGTSSGMPWRKWGHWNRSCGVNEANHADPTLSPLRLTCYSFQLELSFYGERWLHWYTSWLSLNAYATVDAHPTRGLMLKQSSYTYVRFKILPGLVSTLPSSCPASKQQAQRRGMAGRKEEQVRFICSLFFLLVSTQWRASGKMIEEEKNKKKAWVQRFTSHRNSVHLSLLILQCTPKWANLEEG